MANTTDLIGFSGPFNLDGIVTFDIKRQRKEFKRQVINHACIGNYSSEKYRILVDILIDFNQGWVNQKISERRVEEWIKECGELPTNITYFNYKDTFAGIRFGD